MKKITILAANPFSEATSGNDEALTRFIASIDADRFRFVVAMPGESPYTDAYRKLGAEIEIFPMSVIRRDLSVSFLARYTLGFAPTIARFASVIRKHNVDVVHTNTTQLLGAGGAARIMGKPSIYHVHSVSIEKPEWVGKGMALWIRSTSDALIANSRASAAIFLKRGYPADKVHILPNSIRTELYRTDGARASVRNEFGFDDAPLVGFVGRIARIKAIEHFIDAAGILAKRNGRVRFLIVGAPGISRDEIYLDELKAQATRLGLDDRLVFAGRRTDVPRIMQALDALALVSVSEGFGLALIEAMAAGVPVVGASVGGIPDIIDDGVNGFLTPFGDAGKIADAFEAIISDPKRASEMGNAARKKAVESYDSAKLAKKLEDIYLSLASHGAAGSNRNNGK